MIQRGLYTCRKPKFHFYIHAFLFVQGTKRNEKLVPKRIVFFYNIITGTTVYYKSRGGEWSALFGASRIFICVGRLFKHK